MFDITPHLLFQSKRELRSYMNHFKENYLNR